ncbi:MULTISPECIES: 2-keto-3-deoxygluconate permease [Olsenella]|uniref:2-keto-3-deoxygluconate permease n=1 Tax=Olsenella TaxID=133925 RepID=UPI000231F378|nr:MULTISPECIES: 2-keto-3-deoxygluconate permease [Olsenella]EHF01238.1 hypothetical protein HMPREF1008_01718 [Olsenella sp. oral taxon 809 str. F0356]KXB64025.1 putative 2-keto-3-deoxygluconate transporter [Olsenella sp. DNF00959]
MAEAEAEKTQGRFRIPRLPGDIMIYPMLLGLLLHSFVPGLLEIGGFTTAVVHGGNALVFVILFGIGVGINFRSTPKAVKTGIMIIIPKLVLSIALGLCVAFFMGDDLLGLSSLAIIGGVSFCNIALYTGIMAEYGDEAERGAAGILCFTAGPTITMIALGAAGIADISVGQLVGSLLPIVLGIVLGNLFPFVKQLMAPGVNPCIAVLGFALGCGMSLESLVAGGISGIVLAVICLAIGFATAGFDRLTGGTGKAGMACSTIAGTAMTTPPAVAASDASYAALVPVATAQIAAAVIITALVAPLLTGWLDERIAAREGR